MSKLRSHTSTLPLTANSPQAVSAASAATHTFIRIVRGGDGCPIRVRVRVPMSSVARRPIRGSTRQNRGQDDGDRKESGDGDRRRQAPLPLVLATPPENRARHGRPGMLDIRRSAGPDRRITSAQERGGLGAATSYLSLPSAPSRWSRNAPDRLGRRGAGLSPNAREYRPGASPQCAGRGRSRS